MRLLQTFTQLVVFFLSLPITVGQGVLCIFFKTLRTKLHIEFLRVYIFYFSEDLIIKKIYLIYREIPRYIGFFGL